MIYKKLGEITKIFNGIRITRYNDNVEGKETKIFDGKKSNQNLQYDKIFLEKEINEKYYSKKNDILIPLINTNNIIQIKDEINILIPFNYIIIRVMDGYDSKYIFHILKSKLFEQTTNKLMEGTTVHILKISELKKIKIKYIPLKKQIEYGKLLQLIDYKIELEKNRLIVEEKFKESLMFELFGEDYVRL